MTTSRQLTELQQQVYALLLQHRYYNAWTEQPCVALQQNWIANKLGATQADISNAMQALRAARLLARCGYARKGRPQIHFLTDSEAIAQLPDTAERIRQVEPHIDPNPEQIRKTATPLSRMADNRAYEGK